MLIGFAAGGGADTQARLIAQGLEKKYGWKVLPEQAPGNSGLNLAKQLASEPADGTAFGMVVTETLAYSAVASKNPDFELSKFTSLATTARFQLGLVAMKGGEFDSWDKVKAAAAAGKPIRFGTASDRQADVAYHLGQKTGIDFNIVPVKGGAGVMNGLRGGDLDIGWVAGAQSKPVKQGEMINIASGIPAALIDNPEAPKITDLGSDFNLDGYFMFIAPGNMAPDVRKALGDAIRDVLTDSSTEAYAFAQKAFGGASVVTGEELDGYMADSVDASKKLIKAVSN
ncbi:tripartite tricarboxylate transporter substrate-binding protein [Zhengella mangrovi]|uniref:Tripartite tricarboxylate transporter substrate-binding protein n=2 Tax=Zhengella mangrovi TaxID=1982044 RepID=A0A2G1QHA6_9HYPH|nr:tripartite tricarboxylate transporter substrate-binding protein [Zhengella mangrovi]